MATILENRFLAVAALFGAFHTNGRQEFVKRSWRGRYNGHCMKIDVFNHFFPKRFYEDFILKGSGGKDMGKRVQNVPTIADLDARFRVMDEFGEYCQLLSLPAPPMEAMAGAGQIAGVGARSPTTGWPNW